MPIARFEMPDGRVARFEVPEGTTPEQAQALMQSHFKPKIAAAADLPKYNPTDDMSTFQRAAAGVGKAVYDTGRGIGNLFGVVSDKDIAESRQLDKALMDTTAGFWGNVGGNVGMALAPGGALKGAAVAAKGASGVRALSALPRVQSALATAAPKLASAGGTLLAPKSIKSALTVGAGLGAIQPAEGMGERLLNMGIGAGAGAAVPAGVRVYKTGKTLTEPFTQKGREKIVGRAIQAAAGNDADKLSATLREANTPFQGPMPAGQVAPQTMGEIVPGSIPTVGQLAMRTQTPSIAAMERAATQTDPVIMNAAKVRLDAQNDARGDLLSRMAGAGGQRQAAVAERESAVAPLYELAKKSNVKGDASIKSLLSRPSMQLAAGRAANLGAERGNLAGLTQGHHGYQLPKGVPAKTTTTSLLDASGKPITITTPATQPIYSGQTLHDLKLGLDDAIGSAAGAKPGMQGAERASALGTKDDYLNWLESKIPAYGQAKDTFAAMSKPINQMDVAEEILNKSTSSLDGRFYPQKFATALDDKTAAHATGWQDATLEGTMSNSQMNTLGALKEDLQTQAFAAGAGKAGSDTVQKLAYSNMLNQSGVPNWLRNLGGSQLIGGLVGRTGDLAYANANKQIAGLLGETLMDPQMALKMLNLAQGSDELSRLIARGGASLGLLAPALLNGSQK